MEDTTQENKIISTKSFILKVSIFDNKTQRIEGFNDGFEQLELIGAAEFLVSEVREQLRGSVRNVDSSHK